jgi:hypothetical protein
MFVGYLIVPELLTCVDKSLTGPLTSRRRESGEFRGLKVFLKTGSPRLNPTLEL